LAITVGHEFSLFCLSIPCSINIRATRCKGVYQSYRLADSSASISAWFVEHAGCSLRKLPPIQRFAGCKPHFHSSRPERWPIEQAHIGHRPFSHRPESSTPIPVAQKFPVPAESYAYGPTHASYVSQNAALSSVATVVHQSISMKRHERRAMLAPGLNNWVRLPRALRQESCKAIRSLDPRVRSHQLHHFLFRLTCTCSRAGNVVFFSALGPKLLGGEQ
jgi:hypothetical protein